MVQQTPTWSEARRQTTAMSVLDWIALFCLGAALYMTWYANQWIGLWWFNQTVIRENNLVGPVTIFCLIGFILVPSLAWTVVTPERWLLQIDQARKVRKIERMMQLEDLSYKALIARTRAILNA